MRRLLLTVLATTFLYPQFARAEEWQTVLAQAQNDLAQGNLDNADSGFRRAETLLEAVKATGNDSDAIKAQMKKNGLSLVDCLIGIAKVKDRQGKFSDSDDVYEMALNTLKNFCDGGWKSHLYADYLPGIAEMYDRHGKSDQAELAWQKNLDIRTSIEPKNDPSKMLAVYDGYSKFLRAHQRSEEAVEFESKASQIRYNLQN
jgi:tetratricopeptide (TPR) repeat protein